MIAIVVLLAAFVGYAHVNSEPCNFPHPLLHPECRVGRVPVGALDEGRMQAQPVQRFGVVFGPRQ